MGIVEIIESSSQKNEACYNSSVICGEGMRTSDVTASLTASDRTKDATKAAL